MSGRKKRSGGGDSKRRFLRIDHDLIDCAAYRDLAKGEGRPALLLLIELMKAFNGSNNGRIHMSARAATEALGCSKEKALRLFDALRAKGFIKLRHRGHFDGNGGGRASEWILTMFPLMGQPEATPPTREYLQWDGSDFYTAERKSKPSRWAAEKTESRFHSATDPVPRRDRPGSIARPVEEKPVPRRDRFGGFSGPTGSEARTLLSNQAGGPSEGAHGSHAVPLAWSPPICVEIDLGKPAAPPPVGTKQKKPTSGKKLAAAKSRIRAGGGASSKEPT